MPEQSTASNQITGSPEGPADTADPSGHHAADAVASVGEPAGLVFDMQRFSVHDGPGIRTTVFLQGCPLRCQWCSNPESQSTRPNLLFWVDRCDRCDLCLQDVCPVHALSAAENPAAKIQIDRNTCNLCGRCVEVCPPAALQLSGRRMAVSEVLAEVLKDTIAYRRSGGGMTLSGGEPLLQPGFARELLHLARTHGINTAIETCGGVPWRNFAMVLPHLDLVFFDLKHADPHTHRRLAGIDNRMILKNLARVVRAGVELIVRVPIVPGVNDSAESIAALGRLAKSLDPTPPIELLPYHRLGMSKYRALDRGYPLPTVQPPSDADIEGLRGVLRRLELEVVE